MRGSVGGASPPNYLAIHNSEVLVAYQRMERGLAQLVLFQGSSSQLHQLPPISREPKVLGKAQAASLNGKANLKIWQAYHAFGGALVPQIPCSKTLPGFGSSFKIPLGILFSLTTVLASHPHKKLMITSLHFQLACSVTAPDLFISFMRCISSGAGNHLCIPNARNFPHPHTKHLLNEQTNELVSLQSVSIGRS